MKLTALGTSGTILLDPALSRAAQQLAAQDFTDCANEDFSGEEVRDILPPSWLGAEALPLPFTELKMLGLEPDTDRVHLYATCGVGSHTDARDGPAVCVVLHSDGFTFKQGRTRLKLSAGDWFIFDDGLAHEVVDARESTTLLVLTCPLRTAQEGEIASWQSGKRAEFGGPVRELALDVRT
jgi:hypothetical protein